MRKPFEGDYPITQAFGVISVTGKTHTGVDYSMPVGTVIYACEGGVVTYINKNQPDTGNAVEYKSTDGVRVWRSLHLDSYNVEVGQHFDEGWVIGYSGNTGLSTGPHLHQDVKVNGVYQDPEKIYNEDYMKATANDLKYLYLGVYAQDVPADQLANDPFVGTDMGVATMQVLDYANKNGFAYWQYKPQAEKQIADLQAQLAALEGMNSKWEIFKALIKELFK
jgi:hypothetical protein